MPHSTNHHPADEFNRQHTAPPDRQKPSKTRRSAPRQPQPVPLAVWFVPADPADLTGPRQSGPADYWQLPPLLAEKIIGDYANPGSTVLALGAGTAAVERAAARLDCRTPAHPDRSVQPASVDLLILTLHPELVAGARGDAHDSAGGRQVWARRAALLSPRGILAVVLPPGRPPEQPAAVVAAAVGVGLAYLQHIPAVLWTAGEDHLIPPALVCGVLTQLWRPGHDAPLGDLLPAHADVLLFTARPEADPLLPPHSDTSPGIRRSDGGAR